MYMTSITLITVFSIKAGLLLGLWIGYRRGRSAGRAQLEPQIQYARTQLALAEQSVEHHKRINELQITEAAHAREDLHRQILASKDENSSLGQDLQNAKSKITELETILLKDKEVFAAERKQFDELRIKFNQEFETLANQIFESKRATFDTQSREGLNALLLPFKEQLESFRNRIDQVHTESVQGQSTLKGELNRLQQLNQQITQEASNLTKALKRDKKLQGNWGEQKVELLLEQAGLRNGVEFEREQTFKDDAGNNFRPDFVVRLLEGKHIIIDSKVSLVGYSAHIAAEAAEERQRHLAAHVAAIRNHIKELSQKNYPNLVNIESPGFTFLFIAIEPAYLAAAEYAPSLFQEAYEARVMLVTATTLLPVLMVVANLWNMQRRDKSTQELAESAGRVYDKLRVFIEKMDKLGNQLDTTQKTYKETMDTLKDGKGSLVRTAERFTDLGVKIIKKLPASVRAAAGDDEPNDIVEV
jgi:DNA recombination protein RmuC